MKKLHLILAALTISLLVTAPGVGASSLSTTTLVTKGLKNKGANKDVYASPTRALSADGRIAVFASAASNLWPSPTYNVEQVYAYDRITQKVELISHDAAGAPVRDASSTPSISSDGRYVIYTSRLLDLAPNLQTLCQGWGSDCSNVLVYDRVNKTTTVANVDAEGKHVPSTFSSLGGNPPSISRDGKSAVFLAYYPFDIGTHKGGYHLVARNLTSQSTQFLTLTMSNGQPSTSGGWSISLSDDGRYITFATGDSLVAADTNNDFDVYIHDILQNTNTLASPGLDGHGSNNGVSDCVMSADGDFIAYESYSTNVTKNDNNRQPDIFLYNRKNNTTRLISNATDSTQANDVSFAPDISSDGKYVVYTSYATNLVRSDTGHNVDAFIYYSDFGITRRLSQASHNGPAGDHDSFTPSISGDGKTVLFGSKAYNLTPDPIAHVKYPIANLFILHDPVMHIPYYDSGDVIDIF